MDQPSSTDSKNKENEASDRFINLRSLKKDELFQKYYTFKPLIRDKPKPRGLNSEFSASTADLFVYFFYEVLCNIFEKFECWDDSSSMQQPHDLLCEEEKVSKESIIELPPQNANYQKNDDKKEEQSRI